MKKLLLYIAIIFFAYSCGTKRVIYNNKKTEPEKEKKVKRSKSKKIKGKKDVVIPKINNTVSFTSGGDAATNNDTGCNKYFSDGCCW